MRILIVDDSLVMRKIVESAIRNTGLDITAVLHAANGVDGIRTLQLESESEASSLALILCDIHMPIMDGLGFLSELRRRKLAARIPVIMITADPSDPYLGEALAAGAAGYISKPFTVDQIRARIPSLLAPASQFADAAPPPARAAEVLGGAA